MAKTVYFVRHGQSLANVQGILAGAGHDSPLTDLGKLQAKATAQSFKDVDFDLLVTSPLGRSLETLNIITDELGMSSPEVVVKAEFMERDAGEFTGKPKEDYLAFLAAGGQTGETTEVMKERVNQGLSWLRQQKFNNALVVTHNGTTRMIRIIIDNLPAEAFMQLPQLDNGKFLKVDL